MVANSSQNPQFTMGDGLRQWVLYHGDIPFPVDNGTGEQLSRPSVFLHRLCLTFAQLGYPILFHKI
jgi:hypothetical protein